MDIRPIRQNLGLSTVKRLISFVAKSEEIPLKREFGE